MQAINEVYALIIDDNRLNIDVLQTMLAQQGVQALAIDAPRQLSAVLEQLPRLDVIFLDLEFPNTNGFDLLTELKDDPRLADIPVVAYSVHTSELDKVRAAGFDSFLGKPLNIHEFPMQLRRILAHEAVWEV